VKVSHRFALSTAGLAAAIVATAAPSVAGAQQQRQGPGPDTKRVLVTAFRGDAAGGVKLAEELRNRIQGDFNIRTLMPVSKKDIDNTLVSSGYRPDSALSPNDIRELAKLVRGDEIIDGTVTKTGAGYKVNARVFLPRDVALSQPLLSAEGANLGDLAKQVVREYDAARKQLAATQECENGIRDKKIDVAIAAARKGVSTYPKSTLSRLCLASAYQAWKTGPDSATRPWKDSVLAVTTQILQLDPTSKIAHQLQYDVYKAKNDAPNSMKSLIGLMNSDPTNTQLRENVIAELVNGGQAEAAVPFVKQLVADNPGDPQYLRTYWLVLRAAKNMKEAIPAGMAYAAADPSAADSNFYFRMVTDLAADSAYGKAAEMAATGVAKFPKSSSLILMQAQNLRRAGQIPAATDALKRALALDPKAPGAQLLYAQLSADQGNVDEAIKAVQADVAADPTNKERNAAFLLGLGSNAYKAGVASKKPEDFKKAIGLLTASDAINPGAQAKFFLGVSGYQLLAPTAARLQTSKSCADAKEAANYLAIVNTNMPAGGSVQPEAAKQIMGAVGQYQTFIDASAKRYCK
jgi:tetratricopeptide (TPR) repeat protein